MQYFSLMSVSKRIIFLHTHNYCPSIKLNCKPKGHAPAKEHVSIFNINSLMIYATAKLILLNN